MAFVECPAGPLFRLIGIVPGVSIGTTSASPAPFDSL
jgi:hypothetical protein